MFDQDTVEHVPSVFWVSQRNIEEGVRSCSNKCAISLALYEAGCERVSLARRFEKDKEGVIHSIVDIHFSFEGTRYESPIDKETELKMDQFDQGERIEPFIVHLKPKLI